MVDHDDQTGLPTAALLLDRLDGALARARRRGDLVALLAVRVPSEDAVVEVAGRLLAVVRPGDTVSRCGATDFAVCAEGLPDTGAVAELASRVATALSGTAPAPTIGTAASDGRASAAALLAEAQRSREGDAGGVVEPPLAHALRTGVLVPWYQPIVDLRPGADGAVLAYETLVRWPDPERGVLGGGETMELAEGLHLVERLGESMLDQAVDVLAASGGLPGLTVNVAPGQLAAPGFPRRVAARLERSGIDPSRLWLEVAESLMLEELERSREALSELAALGVRIALDDVGVGYSTLAHLRWVPAHALKIDKSFVSALPGSERDAVLVRALATVGEAFGMLVVAEGIESAEQAEAAQALGCSAAQGFLYGAPTPLSAG